TSTFTVSAGGAAIAGTIGNAAGTASFVPTSSLAEGTVYTATITTGAQDLAGNALPANYTWSFTTAGAGSPDVTPPTVFATRPATNAVQVPVNTTVAVTFSENMDPASLTTASFLVSSAAGPVAGTVSA